jgi:hypothetical protein
VSIIQDLEVKGKLKFKNEEIRSIDADVASTFIVYNNNNNKYATVVNVVSILTNKGQT